MAECNTTLEVSLELSEQNNTDSNSQSVEFLRDNSPSENASNDNDRDEIQLNQNDEISVANANKQSRHNSSKGVRALISLFDTRSKNHTKHHKCTDKQKNTEIQQLPPNQEEDTPNRKSRKSIKKLFSLGKSKAIDEHEREQSNNEHKKLKNVKIKQATMDGLTIHSTISNTPPVTTPEPLNDANQLNNPEIENPNDLIVDETRDICQDYSQKIDMKKTKNNKKNRVSFDSNTEYSVKKKGTKNKESGWSVIARRLAEQDLKNRENLIKELSESNYEFELKNSKLLEDNQHLFEENQILLRDLEEIKEKLRQLQERNTVTSVEEMENTTEESDKIDVLKGFRRTSKSFDDKLNAQTPPSDEKRTKKLEKAISEL